MAIAQPAPDISRRGRKDRGYDRRPAGSSPTRPAPSSRPAGTVAHRPAVAQNLALSAPPAGGAPHIRAISRLRFSAVTFWDPFRLLPEGAVHLLVERRTA